MPSTNPLNPTRKIAVLVDGDNAQPSLLEKILAEKLPGWRVKMNIDRYIEQGYLGEDERGTLYINWRSRAEIDQKQLVDLVVGFGRTTGP